MLGAEASHAGVPGDPADELEDLVGGDGEAEGKDVAAVDQLAIFSLRPRR